MFKLTNIYPLLLPLLNRLEPEVAHRVALDGLKLLDLMHFKKAIQLPQSPKKVMGLHFPNPVGLAAGLDKNADYVPALARLGFGFIEVGTITPKPQPGNPKPRLFRLTKAHSLINRMGFNSKGLAYCVQRLERVRYQGILGVNIGKNAATPIEQAVDDYLTCLQAVYPYADYIAINISSPNTSQLRELQDEANLNNLLDSLKSKQQQLHSQYQRYVPLVVKIAPDLSELEIIKMVNLFIRYDIDGIIATNTTIARDAVADLPQASESGGLSGAALLEPSNRIISQLNTLLSGRIPIIGAGGIMSAADANTKLASGASLVQLYTGLIYRGPLLIDEILQGKYE